MSEIKKILETYGVKALNPDDFKGIKLSQKDVLEILKACDAVWIYDGNPEKPHAILTSGLHSNAYFNLSKVLQYPNVVQIFASQLIKKLQETVNIREVDWVVGSPYASITFSFEVARQIGAFHGYCEKSQDDPKKLVWKRFEIPEGKKVLQIEELITTGSTLLKIREAIKNENPYSVKFIPFIGTIVFRPPRLPVIYEIEGEEIEIVSLFEKEVFAFPPEQCRLCKQGSKALKPKEHWKELTK